MVRHGLDCIKHHWKWLDAYLAQAMTGSHLPMYQVLLLLLSYTSLVAIGGPGRDRGLDEQAGDRTSGHLCIAGHLQPLRYTFSVLYFIFKIRIFDKLRRNFQFLKLLTHE